MQVTAAQATGPSWDYKGADDSLFRERRDVQVCASHGRMVELCGNVRVRRVGEDRDGRVIVVHREACRGQGLPDLVSDGARADDANAALVPSARGCMGRFDVAVGRMGHGVVDSGEIPG